MSERNGAGFGGMSEHRIRSRSWSGGRKSKGDRVSCTIRMPTSLHTEAVKAFEEAGYDYFGDFVLDVMIMARDAGLWPKSVQQQQPQLPVSA
jgi:hypothetical protein